MIGEFQCNQKIYKGIIDRNCNITKITCSFCYLKSRLTYSQLHVFFFNLKPMSEGYRKFCKYKKKFILFCGQSYENMIGV